jgi:hypothetical protein
MQPVTWNTLFQILQIVMTSGAAVAVFKGGVAMRDAVRDLNNFTNQLRREVNDHEDRIRALEGQPERRYHERRTQELT